MNIWTGQRGFTIVELLIVIVVIGILAAISLVAYSGVQDRASASSLQSDLRQASSQLEIDRTFAGGYPESEGEAAEGEGLRPSPNNRFEYSSDSEGVYCLTAFSDRPGVDPYHISSETGAIAEGACPGHEGDNGGDGDDEGSDGGDDEGSGGDGDGPAPVGVNLIAPLSEWTLAGGAVYDSSADEITFTSYGSTARAPRVKVDSPSTWRFLVDYNAPSQGGGNPYRSAFVSYYDEHEQPYTVLGGWQVNGQAANASPAGTWQATTWNPGTQMSGPGLVYLDVGVTVTSTHGRIGAKIRNPELIITRQ